MPVSTATTLLAGLVTGLVSGLAIIVMLAEAFIYAGVAGPAPEIVSNGTWNEPAAHHTWMAPS